MFPNVIPVPSHSQTLSLLCFNLWNVNAYNGGGTKTYLNRIKRAINVRSMLYNQTPLSEMLMILIEIVKVNLYIKLPK